MEESNSNNHMANNVARAIVAALDWKSTPGARKDAVSFLESWLKVVKFPVFPCHAYMRSKQEMYEFRPAHHSFLSKGTGLLKFGCMLSKCFRVRPKVRSHTALLYFSTQTMKLKSLC
uniref:Uncharacterized protein n=1 Tax=Salix viminalis TaxID=40686 RepID=A0A6N2LZD6_SALVM